MQGLFLTFTPSSVSVGETRRYHVVSLEIAHWISFKILGGQHKDILEMLTPQVRKLVDVLRELQSVRNVLMTYSNEDHGKLSNVTSLIPASPNASSDLSFGRQRAKDPGMVFVSGATRHVGIRIAQILLRDGYSVRVGVSDLGAAQELAHLAISYKTRHQKVGEIPLLSISTFVQLHDLIASSSSAPSTRDCILLAACEAHEMLCQSAEFPADVFTSCLTTPIKMALRWFCTRSLLYESLDYAMIDRIPGRQTDRKTLLGELNWIFTVVTDTIAWNVLPCGISMIASYSRDTLEAVMLWTYEPSEKDARLANEALKSRKKTTTQLQVIVEIACGSSPNHLIAVKQTYCGLFNRSLEEDIAANVPMPVQKILIGVVGSYRYDKELVDPDTTNAEATILCEAIRTKQLDNDNFLIILSTRNVH
ncbi:Regulatory-associated protein of TOR 1 [Capsicum chinense]|nr:Regulatory-associated protein of TOR 1 [Capsicum chinense]